MNKYKKNINLDSEKIKNKILQYLYKSIDINVKHNIIINKKDLDIIKRGDYIICPKYEGTRIWIIFCQIDDIYYAINFPKHNQRKKIELIMYPINIYAIKEMYSGTILEGIYFKVEQNKFLIIDEVYFLAGQNQLLKPKDDRLDYLTKYFLNNIEQIPNYQMYVTKYFQINNESIQELYEKIKSDTKIQEIIFYPKIYGRNIYSYTIIDDDIIDDIIQITKFILQKTTNPDVYNLLSLKTKNKIGIAYIPDIETSKKCKQWFKDNKSKELIVKCKMDHNNKKWMPVELVE